MFIGTMDGKANVTGREPSVPHATTNNKSQAHHLHTRRWLTISADDPTESSFLELSKTRVTHQLGLQLRDLR